MGKQIVQDHSTESSKQVRNRKIKSHRAKEWTDISTLVNEANTKQRPVNVWQYSSINFPPTKG